MVLRAVGLALVIGCGACGGSPASPVDGKPGDTAPDGDVHVEDGPPTRHPCTSNFGTALTTSFGRLDGFLVAIVPPGGGPCNADSDHVHLQVQVNGAVYDIAITA